MKWGEDPGFPKAQNRMELRYWSLVKRVLAWKSLRSSIEAICWISRWTDFNTSTLQRTRTLPAHWLSGERSGLQRDRKLWGLTRLTVVMASQVYAEVKANQIVYFKNVYMSILSIESYSLSTRHLRYKHWPCGGCKNSYDFFTFLCLRTFWITLNTFPLWAYPVIALGNGVQGKYDTSRDSTDTCTVEPVLFWAFWQLVYRPHLHGLTMWPEWEASDPQVKLAADCRHE